LCDPNRNPRFRLSAYSSIERMETTFFGWSTSHISGSPKTGKSYSHVQYPETIDLPTFIDIGKA
jgi:hypothetical protein